MAAIAAVTGCDPSGDNGAGSVEVTAVSASLDAYQGMSGTGVWADDATLTLFNPDGRKVTASISSGSLTASGTFTSPALEIPSGSAVYAAYPSASSFLEGRASIIIPVYQGTAAPHYVGLSGEVNSSDGISLTLKGAEAMVAMDIDLGAAYPEDTVSAVSVTTQGAFISGSFAVDFNTLAFEPVTARNTIDLTVGRSAAGCSALFCCAPSDWTASDSCVVTVTTQNNIFRIFKRPAAAFAASGAYSFGIDLDELTRAETLAQDSYTVKFIGKQPSGGDEGDDDNPGAYPAATGALSSYTDLSAAGKANCYIVSDAGNYKFDAASAGNGVISVAGIPVHGSSGATLSFDAVDILWTDLESCPIADVKADGSFIGFTVKSPFTKGNVVISASLKGTIVWSWHIWLSPMPALLPLHGYTIMDRNLGAKSASMEDEMDCWGLLYQWGRKDPFLSGSGENNTSAKSPFDAAGNMTSFSFVGGNTTLSEAPATPMTIYKGADVDWLSEPNEYLWGGSNETSTNADTPKTVNDPCPPGYKVPQIAVWKGMKASQTALYDPNSLGNTKGGVTFTVDGYDFWFTFEGYLDINVNEGTYPLNWSTKQCREWTSAPAPDGKSYAMHLMRSGAHEDQKVLSRMQGFDVRCVKDEYKY